MAAGIKAKTTGPDRLKKKRERWVWKKESKHVLDCLRELVATGQTLPDGILPKFDYAVEQILEWHQQWVVQRSKIDKQTNSVAGKVMKSLAAQVGGKVVEQWYREARESGRRAFFDCMVRTVLVSRGGIVSDDLNEAVMIRAIVEAPAILASDRTVLELYVDALEKRRGNFLLDVGADMNNHDERSDKLDVNALLLEVTRHWDDCHCPMWLMSRKAILKAAKALAPGNSGWSEESLKRVLRDSDLGGCDRRPIEDVLIKNGELAGFYVRADMLNGDEPTVVSFKAKGSLKPTKYFVIPKPANRRKSGVRVISRKKC